jgi:hypothetical protein
MMPDLSSEPGVAETILDHGGDDWPAMPASAAYAACYCEENVYLLVADLARSSAVTRRWSVYAVFISNPNKQVRRSSPSRSVAYSPPLPPLSIRSARRSGMLGSYLDPRLPPWRACARPKSRPDVIGNYRVPQA